MGQQKGNQIPSYQAAGYIAANPNTNARENRDYGTKPVMIDDNTTLNEVVDITFETDAVAAMVSASLNTTIYAVSASIGNNINAVISSINTTIGAVSSSINTTIAAVSASINTNIYAISSSINTNIATKANIVSPALTGTPSSTTPSVGDNSTKIATTAFVIAEKLRLLYRADDATITITSADNNKVFIATKASGTQTFTLPGAATAGLQYTFICGNAGGELKILGEMGNTIILKTAAGGTLLSVAADTGIKNTAATNIVGDTITLVSDGATSWYAVSQNGIFASN